MVEKYMRFLDGVYLACIWISGIALFVMTIVIPWGVVNRYVLGTGSSWPEPMAILCMVLFTFIGAAASYRANAHISVTMFTDRVPKSWLPALRWIVDILMALLAVFIMIWGFKLCADTWHQSVSEFPVLMVGYTYLPLPIGSLLTLLFVIERMLAGPQNEREVVAFGQEADPTIEAKEVL
ncbi:MAG: TRAP transporter small permease [Phycisphaerales bacterium]|nr:TRAP transporter small permease [Phycisphaerales bacterium]